jgi:hypothetical protein
MFAAAADMTTAHTTTVHMGMPAAHMVPAHMRAAVAAYMVAVRMR